MLIPFANINDLYNYIDPDEIAALEENSCGPYSYMSKEYEVKCLVFLKNNHYAFELKGDANLVLNKIANFGK